MDRTRCATRNHIEVQRRGALTTGRSPVRARTVLSACRFGVGVWGAAALFFFLVLGRTAGLIVVGLFAVSFALFSGFRKAKGHTLKCAVLGALSGTLNLVDLL